MMGRKSRREDLSPDLTALIDVVFLLLIFFLVSSVFKKEELALLLSLPKSEQGKGDEKEQKAEFLTLELSDEKIALNGKEIKEENLEKELSAFEKSLLVNLRVDGEVRYQRLIIVLDTLQKLKLENVSLITERKKK